MTTFNMGDMPLDEFCERLSKHPDQGEEVSVGLLKKIFPECKVSETANFKNNRDAAAFMIRLGRTLLRSNLPISKFISRSDNNWCFDAGYKLIDIGRRIALGYAFGDHPYTKEIYKAHIRATRPAMSGK